MPHLTLEFSSNIIEKNDMKSLFNKCHEALTYLLPTDIEHCKSRAIECSDFYIGNGDKDNGFVHIDLKVMPGRTTETLEKVTAAIMQILNLHFTKSSQSLKLQITLSLHELPTHYLKITS